MNLYEKLDNTLMKGANAAVKAWNWTTGRTKKDLANIFLWGGSTILAVNLAREPIQGATIVAAVIPLQTIPIQYNHNRIYHAENQEEICILSRTLYDGKKTAAIFGYGLLAASEGIDLALRTKEINSLTYAGAIAAMAVSNFIVRAEDRPKRKDCVRRGIDKLSEIVRDYRQKPALQPAIT